MKRNPTIIKMTPKWLYSLNQDTIQINTRWIPKRQKGPKTFKNRIKAAFLVFLGKADALIWPEGQ